MYAACNPTARRHLLPAARSYSAMSIAVDDVTLSRQRASFKLSSAANLRARLANEVAGPVLLASPLVSPRSTSDPYRRNNLGSVESLGRRVADDDGWEGEKPVVVVVRANQQHASGTHLAIMK